MVRIHPPPPFEFLALIMKHYLIVILLALTCTGCLSICRIPFPEKEYFSDEGVCTNRTWTSLRSHYRLQNPDYRGWKTVFPTIQMRYHITYEMYFKEEDYSKLTGEEIYKRKWRKRAGWIPLTVIWLTSPLDACWDIVCLPWDVLED